MDYSKLSDFEINSAVHNALLNEPYSLSFLGDDRVAWKRENGETVITDRVPYSKNGVHDYCNNPADAWPIIVKNKIMLSPRCAAEQWKAQIHLGSEDIFDNYASAWHANPLRAAMIVFLMMQGSANVQTDYTR